MRNFLTFVAVALVTALTVALVAPPLVDWTARRQMVARAVAARIGAPVVIDGPVALRLLPAPFLEVDDVAIGPRGAPWLQSRSMRLEIGFASLFGPRLALDDVTFDRPVLRLGPRFAPPGETRVTFGRIRAAHAEATIVRADAAPLVLHDLNFDGSADAARGPWRGEGDFAAPSGRARYQFAAGAVDGDALPLQAELAAGATRLDFDGRLRLGDALGLEGAATLAGEATAPDGGVWPWRVAGGLAASGETATLTDAQARLGDEARALEGEGALSLRFGAKPSLDADLSAKTLNVDALLRPDKQTFATPARAAQAFSALFAGALGREAPLSAFSLKLKARAAYLGARALEAPRLALEGSPGAPLKLTLEAGLPGHGQVALDGALELGPAPIFRGKGRGEVGEFGALAAWAAEGEPALAARLAQLAPALPQGVLKGSGDVEISPEGYAARALALDVGGSRFDGDIVYRLPSAERRGRLFLDLASAALDVEEAPNVEAGLDWLGDTDLDFRLKADTLRVARIGLASVSGGSLVVRAKKDGGKFSLERFSLADLGGASIAAEGETSASGRWARVQLDAARLQDFAALLARAAPGPATGWLLQHAADLGAAKATFEARRDGPPLPGPFGLDFLKANGKIAAARFALVVSRAPAPVDAIAAQASLDAADAGALLRRLGVKLAPGAPARGQLSLSGTGQWDRGFDGKARLDLAGTDVTLSGVWKPRDAPSAASGPIAVKSADAFPALAALGLAPAGASGAAVDLSANAAFGPEGLRLEGLAGELAGARVSGALDWSPPPPEPATPETARETPVDAAAAPLSGALEFDHASFGALVALILGRPAPSRPGVALPDAKFASPLLTPPPLDVALKVGALDLGFAVARGAGGRLRLDNGRLAVDDADMALNGGRLEGKLDLRRGAGAATVSGAATLTGVAVERPSVAARLDAAFDFAGAGESALALVDGLAGAGKLKFASARLPRLDPQALARVFARIEQAGGPPEEKKIEAQLGAELDKAPLTLGEVESGLALAGGALRFGPFKTATPNGETVVTGAFGLADLSLALDATETYAKTGRFWSGPAPAAAISLKGPLDAPARQIDVALLAAGLASEAIARETDRIENFEADVRERAMFNRERKAEQFLARRAGEIAEFEAEQEAHRLMELYLFPYTEWAESRREAPATPPAAPAPPKNAAGL